MQIERKTVPFRHWVIEDVLPVADHWILERAYQYLPLPTWSHWVRYCNDCERLKRTCDDLNQLRVEQRDLLQCLNSCKTIGQLSELTGIQGLVVDPTLRGAGIHITDPGGYLQPHLDYALHPQLGLERRLNLVLFLNPEWRDYWGGALDLYDDEGRTVVSKIFPAFNRAVIWEPTDMAFHGTGEVAADAPARVTAASYYLCQPRPGCTRKRALFCPRRVPTT